MNQVVLRIWALVATAVALVLLGVLIGRTIWTGPQAPSGTAVDPVVHNRAAAVDTQALRGNQAGEPGSSPPVFSIPAGYRDLPAEWRSDIPAIEDGHGYAARFDPLQREVIVERCQHPGYFDLQQERPVEPATDFCTRLVWAAIDRLDDNGAVLMTREGRRLVMQLERQDSTGGPRLRMSFDGHAIELVPGSRNDLLQLMEQNPAIAEQRRRLFEYQEAEYQRMRSAQTAAAVTPTR